MNIPAIVWYMGFIGMGTGFLAWSYIVLKEPSFLLKHSSKFWQVVINVLYVITVTLISGLMGALGWLVVKLGAMLNNIELEKFDVETQTMIYAVSAGIFGMIGTHLWMMIIRSSSYAADGVEDYLKRNVDAKLAKQPAQNQPAQNQPRA